MTILHRSGTHRGPGVLLIVLLGAAFVQMPAAAQEGLADARRPRLQVGLGGLPGVGLQAGYVLLRDMYTAEGVLSAEVVPNSSDGDGDVLAAIGLGGALRILGIARTIGDTGYATYDIDVGLRLGPAFLFSLGEETRADKNQRFRLSLEMFARFSTTRGSKRFYAEVGTHRPIFRLGLWFML
jgi:hypothetical protein